MFNSVPKERMSQIATALLVLIALLSLFLIFKTINEWKEGKAITDPNYTTINVEGRGEVEAQPDIAEIYFSIQERATTVEAAQEALTTRMDALLATLNQNGIEEKDIQTSGYNVYPRYEYQEIRCLSYPCPTGSDKIVGYEASHNVTVTLRDLDKTGEIVGVLGSANVTNVSGPTFTFDDDTALAREARQKAIEDAKAKARQLAQDLDVRLVRIVSFYENNGGYPMPYAKMQGYGGVAMDVREEAMASSPSIPTGENKLTSYVTITYQIR